MALLAKAPSQDVQRRAFYAAHVPETLAECVLRASENAQSNTDELSLLRGMLTNFLTKLTKGPDEREAQHIVMLCREIRATLKAESELSAREKGLLHPSALGIFTSMIINIVMEVLPEQKERDRVNEVIMNRVAALPVAKLE